MSKRGRRRGFFDVTSYCSLPLALPHAHYAVHSMIAVLRIAPCAAAAAAAAALAKGRAARGGAGGAPSDLE